MRGCPYCDRKCECGGARHPVDPFMKVGEVKTMCSKCGNTWFHYHVEQNDTVIGKARFK